MSQISLHMVSDSTGSTVGAISRSLLTHFDNIKIQEFFHNLIITPIDMKEVISKIEENPGMVIYNVLDKNLRRMLKKECARMNIPAIPILSWIIEEFARYNNLKPIDKYRNNSDLGEDYYMRIESVNYTLAHDDGQQYWDIDSADILIIGPSRVSKTPTSVYLGYQGYKVANIPFVLDIGLPSIVYELKKPLIIGLTVDSERLSSLRNSRVDLMGTSVNNYGDIEHIEKEVQAARKEYYKNGWLVVDVTKRSIEETSAIIIKHYKDRQNKHNAE